jgi:type VI secretion system protein
MSLILSVRNAQSPEAGAPQEYRMKGDSATIGRSGSCDWTLPDEKNHISSRHAEIRRTDAGYMLQDISTNGTFVNGSADRLSGEHPIAEGDLIRIGGYEIVAHLAAEPAAAPAAPPAEAVTAAPPAPVAAPAPAPDPARTIFQPGDAHAAASQEAQASDAPQGADESLEVSAEQEKLWKEVADANAVDWERGGFGKVEAASAQAASAATADELASAFLAAAEIDAAKVSASPGMAIAKGGALLRRLISGLVVMVEARARAKAQMGAEATQLQLDGNNPIKFARTPSGALTQLLNPTEKGFLDAEKAIEDAFVDLQSHQIATLAAIPGALRATLERFSPGSIKRRAENMGVLARILSTARDAALWANYEREYKTVASQSDDAFMEVFAKEFRKAYAKQIAKEQR